MKNIRETLVFDMLNSDGKVDDSVKDIMSKGVTINKKQMASAFYVIEKNLRYIMKTEVLKAIDDGKIIMKINPEGLTTPSCMPWFLASNGKDVRAIVVLDNIVSRYDKELNTCEVSNIKQLYCLLETAYVGILCYTKPTMTTKNAVIKSGSAIYADMFVKVLNKEYALNVDRNRVNIITFLASKFYLINILGRANDERTDEYAYANCLSPNKMAISMISEDFGNDCYTDIGAFVQALAGHPDLEGYLPKLTVRSFIHQYTMLFGPSCLFALENLPYFLFNVISVSMGAYLNKQKILEPIVDKRAANIYSEIAR